MTNSQNFPNTALKVNGGTKSNVNLSDRSKFILSCILKLGDNTWGKGLPYEFHSKSNYEVGGIILIPEHTPIYVFHVKKTRLFVEQVRQNPYFEHTTVLESVTPQDVKEYDTDELTTFENIFSLMRSLEPNPVIFVNFSYKLLPLLRLWYPSNELQNKRCQSSECNTSPKRVQTT